MQPILELVNQIGHFEFALSILKAIRAKVEYNYGFQDRVGRSFKTGFKGVLAVGEAGGGKTVTLKRIFNGLQLNPKKYCDGAGKSLAVWVPSGISTGVGLFQLLTEHHNAIIFIDELDANTKLHINVLKQIASGQICRMKHQEINPTDFQGLLLGATNGIPFKSKDMSHLVAMLERFTVVYMESKQTEDYYIIEDFSNTNLPERGWHIIRQALLSKNNTSLTKEEHEIGKALFREKARENLEPSKALYRQASDVMDILLFLKRFCNVEDLRLHSDILEVAELLVKNTVHVNPAKLLAMDPIERAVYNFISERKNNTANFGAVLEFCDNYGVMVDSRSIKAALNKMVRARILNRYACDTYATRIQPTESRQSAMSKALI
jgi:hypothetical protein